MIHSWWQTGDRVTQALWWSVLLASGLAWAGLLAIFTLIHSLDLARLDVEHTVVEVLQAQAVIMLPWLIIFPAIAVTRIRQVRVGTPNGIALAELGLLAVVAIFAIYLHIVFVYSPYLQASAERVLDQIPLINWFWDPVMIALVALISDLVARTRRREDPVGAPSPGSLVLRSGNREDIVDLADITAVSAQGNYVSVLAGDREWLHRATLTEFITQMSGLDFIHIHRSHIVRASDITSHARDRGRIVRVTLRSGHSFPVSARGSESLQAHLASVANSHPSETS